MQKILLTTMICLSFVFMASAMDCKKEEVDCVGLCGRYIDVTEDGFCDLGMLSEPPEIKTITKAGKENASQEKPYNLLLISSLTLGLYCLSYLAKRFSLINVIQHRRIWNIVLLITFLVSGVLGLLLVAQINYNLQNGWYLSFLYLHVEFGISMVIVSVIHALWHVKYYAKAFGLKSATPKNTSLT